MNPSENKIFEFEQKLKIKFPNIDNCILSSIQMKKKLQSLFDVNAFSQQNDFVIFGSIARNECTPGSDVDWTLLVDCEETAETRELCGQIRKKIKESGLKDPGASGTFGNLSIKQNLIKNIGGEHDTNQNLTRRILLLLESEKIAFNKDVTVYDKTVEGIMEQYIKHDSGLKSNRLAIPRFLLNDVVRYWRTLCVDFAYKQRAEDGKKWALRNIKLRMSRKLLFCKGLLMCFAYYQERPKLDELANSMKEIVFTKPLEVFLTLQKHFEIQDDHIVELFKSYDLFLETLNANDKRQVLENMKMEEVYSNELFLNLRKICDNFQETLNKIFLQKNTKLKELTLKYAIF